MYKKILIYIMAFAFIFTGCTSKTTPTNDNDATVEKESKESTEKNLNNKEEDKVQSKKSSEEVKLGIHKKTVPQKLKSYMKNNPLESLPKYDPNSLWDIDLRSRDISKFDLEGRTFDLLHSNFNTETTWPEKLPDGFDPNKVMNLNKTPGLNIKKLHEKGITGKGVGVAIIDFPLVLDHIEYKDRIKYYDHTNYPNIEAHFHGPLVTSISIGNDVGVAPGAELYYTASFPLETINGEFSYDYNRTADSIKKLLEVNDLLPQEEKIRVLSISMAWEPEQKGYDNLVETIKKAEKQGIFVVSCNIFERNEKFHFHGLYKKPLTDPDDFKSYEPYDWDKWITMVKKSLYNFDTYYEEEYDKIEKKKLLLIPMGGITAATATGNDHYEYMPTGGWSSAVPYISGLYALTCQVKPDITPEEFWNAAYETGVVRTIEKDGKKYEAKIPYPEKLIEYLQKK